MKSLHEIIPAAINFPIQKENGIALKTFDNDEIKVYEALESMSIGKCSRIEVKEHLKTCLALSGTQIPTQEIFEFCVSFVIETYRQYKLKELGVAFKMYAEDKFQIGTHINFNPKLIGEVMSAYKRIAVEVRKKIEPKETQNVSQVVIDEEQAIKEEIEWWGKSKKDWQMINHTIFDYLWKRKLIKLTKEEADSIKEKVRISILGKATKPSEVIISDEQMKTLAKKYSLMIYFNNL
jgi:hypothetical protein